MYFIILFYQKSRVDEEGNIKLAHRIAYSRVNKRFVAKPVKEEKNYNYVFYILRKILKRTRVGKKSRRHYGTKKQMTLKRAPKERPPRDEVIETNAKYRRIKL